MVDQYMDEDADTNNIEGFWGIMKRGLTRIYRDCRLMFSL